MSIADTLVEAVRLKALPRSGWLRVGVPHPESVAAHSWGVAWLVCVLLPDDLDRARALTYATLHDVAEVRVGDITPHDGVGRDEKAAREAAAWDALTAALPPALRDAWHRYEAQADEEARFVRQLDRLDMLIQAVAYATPGRSLREFADSALAVIRHPALRPLADELAARLLLR